jgi:hypothetical protein
MNSRRLLAFVLTGLPCTALALTPRHESYRFDGLVLETPGTVLATHAISVAELPASDPVRIGWERFATEHGGWSISIDQRSGLPTLAFGAGIPWIAGTANTLPASESEPLTLLEAKARQFLADHDLLLGTWTDQLELDLNASTQSNQSTWLLTFRQVVRTVPVEGARFDFHVVGGNLVAFGATRWGTVKAALKPRVTSFEARDVLISYLGAEPNDLNWGAQAELLLVATDPRPVRAAEWTGKRGDGLSHSLVWRFRFTIPGEMASWVAEVDALTGLVVGLKDDIKYDRVKGAVFPISSDGTGYEGNEQPHLPMPFADFTIDGTKQSASSAGFYSCSANQAATTRLSNQYVNISNSCGVVNETAVCGEDIDLKIGPGTNCEIPAGASAGNTRSARSAFYNVNRNAERARYWLPSNGWIRNPVTVNVNVNATCNATWGGSLNMYRAGGGCRNTAELQGVLVHEWGHGLDQNDGGNYDNPTEGYADVQAIVDARLSCVGPGFFESGTCSDYGDNCINCTGIREQDWDKRNAHTPATPDNWSTNRCGGGDDPCGKEGHCGGHIVAEAIWDLAARDLPASGMDQASAWQLVDRLWFQSRVGSGGNAYNCALPNSDGCGTNSWFHKIRVQDDNDGNLNNGTPHAAAIFAAFQRHKIACGNASDPANQDSNTCPSLSTPSLSVNASGSGLQLSWSAVPGASSYRVLKSDLGCNRSQVPIADLASGTTTYLDTDVPELLNLSYRVQAVAGTGCESLVSNCVTKALVPLRGRVEFIKSSYGCAGLVNLRVVDGNAGAGPIQIQIWSDSEQTPERVTLTETAPGSSTFEGSIAVTTGSATHGDGQLKLISGDQIAAEYLDLNDGAGSSITSTDIASSDCVALAPVDVRITDITDASVTVRWDTPEISTGRVEWGPTSALGNTVVDNTSGTAHAGQINALSECGRYFFRVVAIDRNGNQTTYDNAGQPFGFNVGLMPGFYKQDYEGTSNWSLQGEWQVGTPQGRGTNPPDPTAAFAGTRVLGHDLTGLGARLGDYERSLDEAAVSPSIDASGKTGTEIKFRRWLNVGTYATASVEVRANNGPWNTVWSYVSSFFPLSESAWSLQSIDISQYADNQSNVQVRFRQRGGSQMQGRAGWNVDRFVMRQASDPAGAACGGCAGSPSFGGLTSAVDADPCAATGGVNLSWAAAPAWGTGSTGTYSIYRDTTANFTPTASNRIATGVSGTSYTDASAANGVTYYYLARAENNESCSTGPANSGVVDTNTAYRAVSTTSSQSIPGNVSGLTLQPTVGTDVRLTWSSAAGANVYRVMRSNSPQGPFTQLLETSDTEANDPGSAVDGARWYYLIQAVNACNQVGP